MSKYMNLVENLKKEIPHMLKSGISRLPSEQDLCLEYHVSRQTVRKALSVLTEEKLLEGRRGSGNYLTGLMPKAADNEVIILLSTDVEYIYPELVSYLGRSLSKAGFSVSVWATGNDIMEERRLLHEMLKNPPRGLIAEGCHNALPSVNIDLYTRLKEQGTHLLFLFGIYPNFSDAPYLSDDNYQGGYEAAAHLLHQGHRQIAGIFESDVVQGIQRYYGYITAMKDFKASPSSENVLWFDSTVLDRLQKKQDTGFLRNFVKERLSSCTAIVCYNDEIAYWLIKELRMRGLSVPEDISIVGFDNSYLRHAGEIRLSTMAHLPNEVGISAASMMMDLLKGNSVQSAELKWHLIAGNSDRSL